jgi:hypothetical protein
VNQASSTVVKKPIKFVLSGGSCSQEAAANRPQHEPVIDHFALSDDDDIVKEAAKIVPRTGKRPPNRSPVGNLAELEQAKRKKKHEKQGLTSNPQNNTMNPQNGQNDGSASNVGQNATQDPQNGQNNGSNLNDDQGTSSSRTSPANYCCPEG